MGKGRIVVAMSGGVDSSVAALLLKEQGWEVIGVSLLLSAVAGGSGCCSAEDFRDARRVADQLEIPYYVINLRKEFKRLVTDRFTNDYINGRTPNPCVLCNQELKFTLLRHHAATLGAKWLATGHYAQITWDSSAGRFRLLKARDQGKDQSYFLFTLSQEDLGHTLFPLGRMLKSEVREHARRLSLSVAEKRESQEICFVPANNYPAFIEANVPSDRLSPGMIVDQAGRELGSHRGIHRFTVGQRRGLGVASSIPLYVTGIDPRRHLLKVGPAEALNARGLLARQVSWVAEPFAGEAEVRTRYRQQPIPATLGRMERDQLAVKFRSRFPAVSPGQAAVFYQGDEVLGGGLIESSL